MIELVNLSKSFGKLKVLNNLSLLINTGGIFAILGPNGSGKTTLIKCLLGMTLPDKGKILLNKQKILNRWSYRSDINYLPQIASFPPNLTVSELIAIVKAIRSKPSTCKELIDLFGLNDSLKKKLGNLSGGTKQKVNLVLAFMFDSSVLILDEPTSGLDPISLFSLKKLIQKERDRGKTILITTHVISLVDEIADEIVFLLDGKIYFKGSIMGLKKQVGHENLERAIIGLIAKRYKPSP